MAKKKEIKADNYYIVKNWMPLELGLGGSKLLVYAFLYAYSISENGNGCYYGGLEILSKVTGCTKKTAISTLAKLEEEKLIEKRKILLENGLERSYFRVLDDPLYEINLAMKSEDLSRDLEILGSNYHKWREITGGEDYRLF